MPKPLLGSIDYEALLPFCISDVQRRTIAALIKTPNAGVVAKQLGVARGTVRDSIASVCRTAAIRGHAPAFDRRHTVPETERIKGVSTLYDGDELDKQWVKTEAAPVDPPVPAIIDAPVIRQSVYTDRVGAVLGTWSTRVPEKQQEIDRVITAMREHIEQYAGAAGVTKLRSRTTLSKGLLEAYVLGDPHVGMHAHEDESGDNFDLKIVEQQLGSGVDLLAERANPASSALVINVGDYFHSNDHTQLTPGHKHKLDVDSRPHKILRVGYYLLHRIVTRLLAVHEHVDVWNIAGNHDPLLALSMNLFIEAIFRDEPRVTVHDNAAAYMYREFGKNMIMAAHGHLAPMRELPGIASARQAPMWGRTTFRHAFTGHVHHERLIECPGMRVESARTLAPKDSYAAGRYNAGQSLQAVTFHKEYGIIARREVGIEMVKARLAGAI